MTTPADRIWRVSFRRPLIGYVRAPTIEAAHEQARDGFWIEEPFALEPNIEHVIAVEDVTDALAKEAKK